MNRTDNQVNGFDYERKALQFVSRSFALTIPQLPDPLRFAVTNAYLICRIIDTIEDEQGLEPDQKLFFFHEFMDILNGRGSAHRFSEGLVPLLNGSTLPAEKDLVGHAALIVSDFESFTSRQQTAIRRCAGIMAEGMYRFQKMQADGGLRDLSDLEQYCYHVAGVVGEMLTELFCDYSDDIAVRRKKMLELGVSFGKGLQMTNIVKDVCDDHHRGVCWLPRTLFSGIPQNGERPADFIRALTEVIGLAQNHLADALDYTLLIPRSETGIRKFCLWAIGMAVFTLRKINKKIQSQSGRELEQNVKISRQTTRAIILVTSAAVRSNYLLAKLFGASGGDAFRAPAVETGMRIAEAEMIRK